MTFAESLSVPKPKRDYSLVGQSTQWAVETGLASAKWYHSDIPRTTMKELIRRSDDIAIRDTILWLALILGSAAGGIFSGVRGGAFRSFSSTASSTALLAIPVGMKAGTAQRSRHAG